MKMLLDTNFLMIPGKFKVDVFSELQKFGKPDLYTLRLVVKELERISGGKGRDAPNAKLALGLLEQNKVKILMGKGTNTDSELLKTASSGDYVVCTQDGGLMERLKKRGVQVIHLRQGKHLELWCD